MNKHPWFFLGFLLVFFLTVTATGQDYELAQETQFRELPNWTIKESPSAFQQDKDGFLWFGTESGLYRFDGNETRGFHSNPQSPNGFKGNWVSSIAQDSNGHFWLGVFGVGLHKFDPTTEEFTFINTISKDSLKASSNLITKVILDSSSNVWTITHNGLWKYIPPENKSLYYSFNNLAIGQDGSLWAVNKHGIYLYNNSLCQFELFYKNNHQNFSTTMPSIVSLSGDLLFSTISDHNLSINLFSPIYKHWKEYKIDLKEMPASDIVEKSRNKFLITIFNLNNYYLYTLDIDNEELKRINFDEQTNKYLKYSCLAMPINENVLVCSNNTAGILYNLESDHLSFQITKTNENNLISECCSINKLPNDQLMLSSQLVFNTESGTLTNITKTYPALELIQTKNSLFNNEKWVQTKNSDYLICTSSIENPISYKIYSFKPNSQELVYQGGIIDNYGALYGGIIQDENENIWLGCWGSVLKFDLRTNTYEEINSKLPKAPNNGVIFGTRTIFKDSSGDIWIGTQNGLYYFNSLTEKFKYYINIPNDTTSLSYNTISSIREDKNGIIWIGTFYGLNAFDKKTEKFTPYYFEGDSNDNKVQNIKIIDSIIWFTNGFGINQFNPKTGELNTFNRSNGLLNDEFYEKQSLLLDNGKLLFAGSKGIDIIDPKILKKNPHIPPIKITAFSLFNEEVDIMGADSILKQSIVYTKEIELNHDQNVFSFRFAALDYTAPDQNEYAYQLVGFDDDWQYIGHKHEVTFTNLDPGSYVLKIKGSNNDGIWNEEGISLKIIIHPPWYWAWWTKSLYALVFISLLYIFYRFQLNRRLAENESIRLKEIDEVKNRLYANITHEFRTPLTIIQGMVDQIKGRQYQQQTRLIKRNNRNLLRLVNQMLNLSKLESGKLNLNPVQADIITFLKTEIEAYIALATSNNIELHFHASTKVIYMDFDVENVRQILSNLLSNAIKFMPNNGGYIRVSVGQLIQNDQAFLQLEIEDNGIGIPEEQLPNIFDRFYQVDTSSTRVGEGTGIGLSLTKELIQLMNGSISVSSEVDKRTIFTILLPISHKAPLAEIENHWQAVEGVFDESPEDVSLPLFENPDHPVVLIIEDNQDVIHYLITCLQNDYQILTALNGKEGIQTAIDKTPDIIISDVMMPEADGFEVCQRLKKDERTSHIPIILLTAKADMSSKIDGIESGADAYLYKPFHKEELIARLKKLIELRQQLQKRYVSPAPFVKTSSKNLISEDDFLIKFKKQLDAKIDDSEYDIVALAKDMNLSRSQLYRKIKALTGYTAATYVRIIRLHHARHLLQTTEQNVAQIAYSVGFKNATYFSRAYLAEFGHSPSEEGQ